jgi:purine-nucleoside phosphorylase
MSDAAETTTIGMSAIDMEEQEAPHVAYRLHEEARHRAMGVGAVLDSMACDSTRDPEDRATFSMLANEIEAATNDLYLSCHAPEEK